jgi:hypothetical protein
MMQDAGISSSENTAPAVAPEYMYPACGTMQAIADAGSATGER